MGIPGGAEILIIIVTLIFSLFPLIAIWKIITKAGYSGILVLLGLVPILNIIMLFVFAFSEWPIEKKLRNSDQ